MIQQSSMLVRRCLWFTGCNGRRWSSSERVCVCVFVFGLCCCTFSGCKLSWWLSIYNIEHHAIRKKILKNSGKEDIKVSQINFSATIIPTTILFEYWAEYLWSGRCGVSVGDGSVRLLLAASYLCRSSGAAVKPLQIRTLGHVWPFIPLRPLNPSARNTSQFPESVYECVWILDQSPGPLIWGAHTNRKK